MVTTLFVVSSVGSSTRGLESCLEVALESVGRSVLCLVGFIGGGCREDSRVSEVIVPYFDKRFAEKKNLCPMGPDARPHLGKVVTD
jgi:hypothetical protein